MTNVCESDPDLPFAELLYEIEDEFAIKIPDEDMKRWTGRSMRSSCTSPRSIVRPHDGKGSANVGWPIPGPTPASTPAA